MNATASDQRERLPQFRAEARTARPARTAHPPAGREPPAPPADGLPMTPRFLTETWRGETRILFSIRAFYKWRRVAKYIPNRTLRPAGRPCGRERGFARCGGLCAWRVIARGLNRPFSAGCARCGRALGLSRCGGRFYCVLFRVGYTGRFREAGTGGCGQRPTGAVRSVPRGSANRVPRRRGRGSANRAPRRRGRAAAVESAISVRYNVFVGVILGRS